VGSLGAGLRYAPPVPAAHGNATADPPTVDVRITVTGARERDRFVLDRVRSTAGARSTPHRMSLEEFQNHFPFALRVDGPDALQRVVLRSATHCRFLRALELDAGFVAAEGAGRCLGDVLRPRPAVRRNTGGARRRLGSDALRELGLCGDGTGGARDVVLGHVVPALPAMGALRALRYASESGGAAAACVPAIAAALPAGCRALSVTLPATATVPGDARRWLGALAERPGRVHLVVPLPATPANAAFLAELEQRALAQLEHRIHWQPAGV
jgi:hypothetical protein